MGTRKGWQVPRAKDTNEEILQKILYCIFYMVAEKASSFGVYVVTVVFAKRYYTHIAT